MSCWKAGQGLVSRSPQPSKLAELKVQPEARSLWMNGPVPHPHLRQQEDVGRGLKEDSITKKERTRLSAVAPKLSCS